MFHLLSPLPTSYLLVVSFLQCLTRKHFHSIPLSLFLLFFFDLLLNIFCHFTEVTPTTIWLADAYSSVFLIGTLLPKSLYFKTVGGESLYLKNSMTPSLEHFCAAR